MKNKKTLVITTVNKPTVHLKRISYLCKKNNINLILIGDKKSPKKFKLENANFYNISQQEKLSFDFGLGLGFGNRLNSWSTQIHPFSPVAEPSFEKTVFTYEFSLLLDYAYSENLSAFGGYRLVGASDNGLFDRMVSHLFEVGVGANF